MPLAIPDAAFASLSMKELRLIKKHSKAKIEYYENHDKK